MNELQNSVVHPFSPKICTDGNWISRCESCDQLNSDPIHTPIYNMHQSLPTLSILAVIVTLLDQYGRVNVVNAALPVNGPGTSALMLGLYVKREELHENT